jgi:putative membrane protein
VTNFLIRVIANAAALWVAALLVSGIDLAQGDSTWTTKLVTVLLVALVFGVVNAFIRPIVKLLSLPLLVLTLGLFTFIVNAFMLQITEWLSGPLGLDFHIQSFFWDAVMAAVIITVVSWAVSVLLPSSD